MTIERTANVDGSLLAGGPSGTSADRNSGAECATENPVAFARKKLNRSKLAEIESMFVRGVPVSEIAAAFSITTHGVWYHATQKGWKRPRKPWAAEAQQLFESGATCREIGSRVGVAEKTVMQEASSQGWQRCAPRCYKCNAEVPLSKKRNSADRRVCRPCEVQYYREKAKRRKDQFPEDVKRYRQAYKAKLHASGKRKPMSLLQYEYAGRRESRRQRADVQRGRYMTFGEPPINQAGALAILQATLRKLLATRCEGQGLKLDSVEYRARYNADPAFRERERLRTSGKRWGNRADGRDDGTLTKDAVRRLFAKAKKCPYCWQPMKSQDKSLDHMEPLSLGGWHSLNNVLVCCRRCNSRKSDSPWIEWLGKIPAACEKALRETAA